MKNIRSIALIAILLTAFKPVASAQFYFYDSKYYDSPVMFEVGGSLGSMNCLTDIGGRHGLGKAFFKDLNIGNTRFNGSIYLSALYKYAVGLRLEGTFGQVKAYDSILKPVRETAQGRYERNLHFRSKITEVSLVAEFHIRYILNSFLFEDDLNYDKEPPRLSPYIAAGIGFFSFNPQAKLGNNWIDLQPLSLEGQGFKEYPARKPYKLTGFNMPVGIGLKYELSSAVNLRVEYLHRILSTDYLDDVSTRYINENLFQTYFSGTKLQNALLLARNERNNPGGPTGNYRKTEGARRGDSKDKDSYFTFNFKIGIAVGRELIRKPGPQRF